jgi:hypothetical protein
MEMTASLRFSIIVADVDEADPGASVVDSGDVASVETVVDEAEAVVEVNSAVANEAASAEDEVAPSSKSKIRHIVDRRNGSDDFAGLFHGLISSVLEPPFWGLSGKKTAKFAFCMCAFACTA